MEEEAVQSNVIYWEELANALTHGFGLLLSLVGLPWLLQAALNSGDILKISSASVFGGSLVLLYAASTLYHSFKEPRLKQTLKVLDHCAIYVLIAGSYTPFLLITLEGAWGWTLFGIVWSLAFMGIALKVAFVNRWPLLSTLFYLGMGWLVVVAIKPLIAVMDTTGLVLMFAGGLSYTIGAIIYYLERHTFHHAVWHLFVIGGSVSHYFAILDHVIAI